MLGWKKVRERKGEMQGEGEERRGGRGGSGGVGKEGGRRLETFLVKSKDHCFILDGYTHITFLEDKILCKNDIKIM